MEGCWGTKAWLSAALALVCFYSACTPAMAVTDPGDVRGLRALQKAWGGDTSLWQGSDPCSEDWLGVLCDGNNTRVTSLYLVSRDLAGEIPPSIASLSALQNLDLSFNRDLGGELPAALGSLSGLLHLSLQNCGFSGRIPSSLGRLTNLKFFAVNSNRLAGEIPSALGALANLTWFDVAYNRFSGPLPVSTTSPDHLGLDTWPNIQHYHLNDNNFSGSIPPELGKATKCVHMLLEVNSFTGPIPDTFGNLTNLQILSLHYNKLTGPIPDTLNNIIKVGSTYAGLHQIRVSNNQLSGTLPSLNALDQLEYVDFSNNSFNPQRFPAWLNASSSTLQTIRFENCNLVGPLPADILSYPELQGLYLQKNELNGTLTITEDIGESFQYVSLQHNNFASIVQLAPNTTILPQIQLQGNPLCTLIHISHTFCSSPNPKNSSSFSSSPTTWTSPLALTPACPSSSSCLASLTLNPFTCHCSIPLVVTLEFRALPVSNIRDDALWESLRNQTFVGLRNLSTVTPAVDRTQIWVYKAYFNESLVDHLKVQANVYFFSAGKMLEKGTEEAIVESLVSQKAKFGSPFRPFVVVGVQSSREVLYVVSGLSKRVILGIAVGAGALVALAAVLALVAFRLKRRAEEERKKNPFAAWQRAGAGEAPSLKGARWFTFDDIRRMTNDFDDYNMLGVGGYGKVYKGILAGTGALLAVKRAQEGSKQGAHEFKNEIELLSRVHHNHLVGLVGFCYEKAEQILVYEYIPNGSLTEWLRGTKSNQMLNWDARLQIALGAARGLAYLHENANPPIIHRDVKSCNILLDKSMNAKVADFGMSVLVPNENEKLDQTIKGTAGYLDPEYYSTGVLSPKSDVYSFGVVLLELITGRPPVSRDGPLVKGVRLFHYRKTTSKPGIYALLDPVLVDTPLADLEALVKLALDCVEEMSVARPGMRDVVKQLELLQSAAAGGGPSLRTLTRTPRTNYYERVPVAEDGATTTTTTTQSSLEDAASGAYSHASASSSPPQSSHKYNGGFKPSPR